MGFHPATKLMAEQLLSLLRGPAGDRPSPAVRAVRTRADRSPDPADSSSRSGSGSPISLSRGGEPRLNPIYIDDLVEVFAQAVVGAGQGVINVGGPTVVSIRDIAEAAGDALGRDPVFETRDREPHGDLVADIRRCAAVRLRSLSWSPATGSGAWSLRPSRLREWLLTLLEDPADGSAFRLDRDGHLRGRRDRERVSEFTPSRPSMFGRHRPIHRMPGSTSPTSATLLVQVGPRKQVRSRNHSEAGTRRGSWRNTGSRIMPPPARSSQAIGDRSRDRVRQRPQCRGVARGRRRRRPWVGLDLSDAVDIAANPPRSPPRRVIRPSGHHGRARFAPRASMPCSPRACCTTRPRPRMLWRQRSALLKPGGEILFYVYARKAPVREWTDD